MRRACLLALLTLSLVHCGPNESALAARSRIPLVECEVRVVRSSARCGTFLVPENRDNRSGRQIALNLVVIPARGSRQTDAVFYLAGGPGASAIDSAGPISRELREVNQTRDLVFVDVRGTGRSSALRCRPIPDDAPLQRYFDDFLDDGSVRECLDAQTADVRFYTEPYVVDDLDEVREALGYDRVNLYGSSGGTRVALLYIRRYGERVRSAALHGVHPLDGKMPLAYSGGLETAVESVLRACTEDAGCASRHPRLRESWQSVKERFSGGEVETDVAAGRGRRERVRISRGVFAEGLRHLLYDPFAPDIPSIIEAAGHGDFELFARRHIARTRVMENAVARGMFLTSTCAEDVRFITEDDIRTATGGTFLGDYRVRRQQAACRIWPRGEGVSDDFLAPVRSDTPVLMVSGDADVATPAAQADRVARELPNAKHVVFPRQGHMLNRPDCAGRLVSAFITAGSSKSLDLGCVGTARGVGDGPG